MDHDYSIATDDGEADAGPFDSTDGRTGVWGWRALLQRVVESGVGAGVAGGAWFLASRRAFQRGERGRGIAGLILGGLYVAVAIVQRRSRDTTEKRAGTDRTAGVDTALDIEDGFAGTAEETKRGSADISGDPVHVDDSQSDSTLEGESADRPAVESEPDELEGDESMDDAPEETFLDRIGEAAFDRQSGRIPVPQRAFNNGLLTLNGEAFWGIRETDDAVVVSQLFDPIQDGDDVRYVASTQVDGNRMLTVPDTALNHWDRVAGGGTAVVSGDGLVFVTGDRLRSDSQLLLVPANWADDLLDRSE